MGAIAKRLSQRRWKGGQVRAQTSPRRTDDARTCPLFHGRGIVPNPLDLRSPRTLLYDYDWRAFGSGSSDVVFAPLR